MRDYSEYGMREKLISRFSSEEAEETLSRLKELGYIDDLRYAENFVVSKLLSGFGIYAVIRKLREKGVDVNRGYVLSVAEKRDIDTDALLENALKKYLAKTGDEDRISVRSKCLRFMLGRGFDIYEAEKRLEAILKENDFR
ncbi:regulatory protein RecX [Geovibrio thiophilus]|uniref:Regulatory protein RecX n=2 Tax=Geovibrio thiophilus TaxID=139438 RepID=A0A3R5UW37_9BACT|nr:regulatory protein RecX [Geovibrio thiophilus]QAR31951.1 regulatory protein RecX [Geovibrio thiophilus]